MLASVEPLLRKLRSNYNSMYNSHVPQPVDVRVVHVQVDLALLRDALHHLGRKDQRVVDSGRDLLIEADLLVT